MHCTRRAGDHSHSRRFGTRLDTNAFAPLGKPLEIRNVGRHGFGKRRGDSEEVNRVRTIKGMISVWLSSDAGLPGNLELVSDRSPQSYVTTKSCRTSSKKTTLR